MSTDLTPYFQIDPNTFGKGLMIFHYGSIIVLK